MPNYASFSGWIEALPVGDPRDLVARYARAIDVRDAGEAEELCTVAGWLAPRGGVGRLFRVANRARWRIAVRGEALVRVGRAAVEILLHRRAGVEPTTMWVLLHRCGGAWSAEGVTRSEPHASDFLEGRLPALLTWATLAPSAAARRLGEAILARVDALESEGGVLRGEPGPLTTLLLTSQVACGAGLTRRELTRALELYPGGPACFTLRLSSADGRKIERTVYLQLCANGEPVLREVSALPSLETLLSLAGSDAPSPVYGPASPVPPYSAHSSTSS